MAILLILVLVSNASFKSNVKATRKTFVVANIKDIKIEVSLKYSGNFRRTSKSL